MMKLVSQGLLTVLFAALLSSCGGGSSNTNPQGQVVGASYATNYAAPVPVGMTWVPSGILRMGNSDQDVKTGGDNKNRTVQMFGFYMDATEISNAEYRQFTEWVRDSIAHAMLGLTKTDDITGAEMIDWKQKVKWNTEEVQEGLATMFIPAEQSVTGRKLFDNRGKLVYNYEAYDFDEMNRAGIDVDRSTFKKKSYSLRIYPDTTVWVKMFSYAYNEPIAQQYNWFKAFDNYPVVGVTWNQANAFCHWRTQLWRNYRESKKQYTEGEFRLPTEAEWEWAARGGLNQSPFPWGGPYIINKKGCYLANFKPNRGNYGADGGLYTQPVNSYWPNDYGLYNMAGNVSEWTTSSFVTNSHQSAGDLSPETRMQTKDGDPAWLKRKVIRGGSWKDVQYYLQNGTRDWEFADTAKAYIGFRCMTSNISAAMTNRPPSARK
jgi:formylglycine-generating enzyme